MTRAVVGAPSKQNLTIAQNDDNDLLSILSDDTKEMDSETIKSNDIMEDNNGVSLSVQLVVMMSFVKAYTTAVAKETNENNSSVEIDTDQ